MIQLHGVRKSYGENQVLAGIDLQVARGEVLCLIGPSGSGKSTILRCINGLESYDHGDVTVEGIRVQPNNLSQVRRHVSMVFQRFNLFPHRTALENIAEGPVYVQGVSRAEAHARARILLERVGLAGKADAYPSQLSGGQQQRIGIARALAMEPQAILFDEPTSALDPELVGDVLQLMRSLADDRMTMIVVTHEIGFAREVADRVAFLDRGQIVEAGSAAEVLDTPKADRTRDFLRRVLRPV
jgi:polar amino acid transport system ATP-binding protein